MDSSSVSPARNSEPQLRVQVRIMIAVAIGICRSLLAIRSTLAVLLAHFGTPIDGVMISPSSMDIWKGFISLHTGTFEMVIYDMKKRENAMYVYLDI